MQRIFKHWIIALTLTYLTGVCGGFDAFGAAAASQKRARWNQPAIQQSSKKTKPSNQKQNKKSTNVQPKKKAPKKKSIQVNNKKSQPKETASKSSAQKQNPTPRTKPAAKPPIKELTLQHPMTDDDIDAREERSTSPLLFVFAAFVLACVGGMFFISARRKQMEAARANFQDHTSNHEAALQSRAGELDMSLTSDHRAPTTGTLFNQAPPSGRSTVTKESLLEKISSKASGLIRSSSKIRSNLPDELAPMPKSAFSFSDDTAVGDSITTISAVKSVTRRQDTRAPDLSSSQSTQESMSSSTTSSSQMTSQGEPCSFERYVEIQIACRCWRAQEIPVNQMLQKTFGINTEVLIQYEFYWKQKISGNINLRKKFEELEPLYSAKYQVAS